ncbi:hypothetical protein EAE96_008100 [Botrytis aclada]|nr:hypothetical protein EAE96_008100 [Botrytis aclada]
MSSLNSHPEGPGSQDSVDLSSTAILQPSTLFDAEEQSPVLESAELVSMDATMDRNPVDENSDSQGEDNGKDEQRGRLQTPSSRTLSPASVNTEIPSTGSPTLDPTSIPNEPLEELQLNSDFEPNLTLAHITSLPQTNILDYISAYRLARQRSFESYVHPLLSPSQIHPPNSGNHTLNNTQEDSDSSSSSTSSSIPAVSPGRERSHYQDSAEHYTSPDSRLPPLAPLSPSPNTWRPGSGLPLPWPYRSQVNGDNMHITLTGGQDNMAANRRDREASAQARRIGPPSSAELENQGSIGIDSDSDLQAQIQVQSDRLRQASPDSRGRIRDTLTRLTIQRAANRTREQAGEVDAEDPVEAATWSITPAPQPGPGDPTPGDASSTPALVFNQDNTISFSEDRALPNSLNHPDSSVAGHINAVPATRRARSGLPPLPSETPPPPNLEPANTYYAANPPAPNRSEFGRYLFNIAILVRNIRIRHLFELQDRTQIASMSPEQLSEIEAQNLHPSVLDMLIGLESQIGRIRDQVLGTALRRPEPEAPTRDVRTATWEDFGTEIDHGTSPPRSQSGQSDHANEENSEPILSMAEQLAAYQMSRNTRNPESSQTNRSIARDMSPHDNRGLPAPSQVLASNQNDLSNTTTRIQIARRRAELQLAESRIRAALPAESREISPHEVENPNTLTHTPRLRPSTSFENLRLERQLAALSMTARNTIPAHRRNLLPRAQRERDAANAHRVEMLEKPAITVFEHLGKWQLHLENAATRIDSLFPEEWSSRVGKYTLVPRSSSAQAIEDVSGIVRSDEEILAAYSANTSYGFREILRMAREDGLSSREAWHYVLLWKDYLAESPIDEYHEALGLCPMDVFMHVVVQGLNRGFGDWKMSAGCKRECVRYLVTRTSYYPFPSSEAIDAARDLGDVTSQTLREYFGSDCSFLDEEWDMLAALKNEQYSTARILHLAQNIARGIAKLDTLDLKPPYDESNNAKRKDIFHRLKLEEIALQAMWDTEYAGASSTLD